LHKNQKFEKRITDYKLNAELKILELKIVKLEFYLKSPLHIHESVHNNHTNQFKVVKH